MHTTECDAADEEAICGVIQKAVDDTGRLDVFFANAARVGAAPLQGTDTDDLSETLRVNVNR